MKKFVFVTTILFVCTIFLASKLPVTLDGSDTTQATVTTTTKPSNSSSSTYSHSYSYSQPSKQKVKCQLCNGSGWVKYYYGSSALEAYLSGHNDYETRRCTWCNGKGYYYE